MGVQTRMMKHAGCLLTNPGGRLLEAGESSPGFGRAGCLLSLHASCSMKAFRAGLCCFLGSDPAGERTL